jgi:hypothetical protein
MAVSISAADATPCSTMRIASRPMTRPSRLDANPGLSVTVIGVLPMRSARATAHATAPASAVG